MHLSYEIEWIREQQGLTVKWFAKSLGLSRDHYYKILNGDRKPSSVFLGRVLRRYPELAETIIKDLVAAAEAVDGSEDEEGEDDEDDSEYETKEVA